VNNQAVAISRRGHDSIALFRQAEAADPTDEDYAFNLAVSLHNHGDKTEALTQLAQALKLRPGDSEAKAADAAWKAAPSANSSSVPANKPETASAPLGSTQPVDPIERIKRTYNGAAFRQAALMLDQVEAAHLATLPAAQRADRLSRSAQEKLDRGLLLEAERGYQGALAANSQSAQAHAGLAQVRERAGDTEAARKEAQAALALEPNPQSGYEACMVLARLDLAQNHLPQAHDEATQALKFDPTSRPARDLRKTIENRMDEKATAKP